MMTDRTRTAVAICASLVWLVAVPAIAVAQERSEEAADPAIFSLEPGLVIWTWILFLITLAILSWKVFPMIAGGL